MKNGLEAVYMKLLAGLLVFIPIIIICTVLFATGTVTAFVTCFAVDSQGKVYVGEGKEIGIYENQKRVGSINIGTSKGYSFAIQGDMFLLRKGSEIYMLDLNNQQDANIQTNVDQWERMGNTDELNNRIFLRHRQYFTLSGDVYELRNVVFRTNIIKNNDITVYQISALSFIAKIVLYLWGLSFSTFIIVIVIQARKHEREGWYSSRFKWNLQSKDQM